jgi:hypothetical protein
MPLTEEQKEQLAALMADADPGDIPVPKDYVPTATMTQRLKEKDKKLERERANLAAANATTAQELADAQARLKEIDDEALTAEQLRDQALTEANKRYEAQQKLTQEAQARADSLYQRQLEAFKRDSVTKLIAESGITPARPLTAVREAMAENNFSVVDPDGNGNFSLELTRDDLPVDNVAEGFGEWYKTRSDLHAVKGTQAVSPGAGRPPGAPPPKDPLEGLSTGYSQFAKALEVSKPAAVPVVPDTEQ